MATIESYTYLHTLSLHDALPICAARSAHPSLRHRRDRQRELAVQESKLSTVTTGAKGDVVLGYDGSGLRPPPSYPRTTMRWWSPFTCRSRSPLPRRLTILNIPP